MKGKEKVNVKIVWEGVDIYSNSVTKLKFVFGSDGCTPLGCRDTLKVISKDSV